MLVNDTPIDVFYYTDENGVNMVRMTKTDFQILIASVVTVTREMCSAITKEVFSVVA
jgi:hypothetical protein